MKGGNILLSVHTESSDERSKAQEIFERRGAEDIASTGEESVRKAKVATRA